MGLAGRAGVQPRQREDPDASGRRAPGAAGQAGPRAAPRSRAGAAAPPPATSRWPSATRTSRRVIDELGTLTFQEMDVRSNRLAHSLADAGVKEGDGVAIMCRNHRGFIDATVAVSKLGADSLYLNTAFAAPQLTEVVKREKPVGDHLRRGVRRPARGRGQAAQALRRLARRGEDRRSQPRRADRGAATTRASVPPDREGRAIILTSGHHRHAEGRVARLARSRSTRPCRCCRRSRSTRARRPTSRRRCSTPGASPTSRSG